MCWRAWAVTGEAGVVAGELGEGGVAAGEQPTATTSMKIVTSSNRRSSRSSAPRSRRRPEPQYRRGTSSGAAIYHLEMVKRVVHLMPELGVPASASSGHSFVT